LFGDYVPSWSANLVRGVGRCNGQLMLLSIGLTDEVMSSTESIRMMMGRPSREKVPVSTCSPSGIASMVV
jgi:hypothetical protein